MNARPAAVEKAESLYKYALDQGASTKDFLLAISDAEGLELLDWWSSNNSNEQLALDVAEAHLTGDPFPALSNFVLNGLPIVRKADLH